MATTNELPDKTYIDRGVQTDPIEEISRPVQTVDASFGAVDANVKDDMAARALICEETVSKDVSFINPIKHNDEEHGEDTLDDLPSLTETITRSLQRLQLSHGRPSSIGRSFESRRIASLPEAVSEYSVKETLKKSVKFRVASMPNRTKSGYHSITGSPSSEHSFRGNILLDDDEPARVRVRSSATDIPHTPSPPSSPESVVIIGSKSQLSEGFLRGQAGTDVSSCPSPDHDDEDWINWAKSPPRPIPALHGPLSLPYARCPSGAEGTIIEEQDNLPRMIWGLDNDESGRSRQDHLHESGSMTTQSSRKNSARPRQTSVPPRFNHMQLQAYPEVHNELPLQQPDHPAVPAAQHHMARPQIDTTGMAEDDFIIPPHGPIDLSTLARPRSGMGVQGLLPNSEFSSNQAYGPLEHALRFPGDMDMDWHAFSSAQDRLRTSMLTNSASLANTDLGERIRPSESTLSLSSLASSRSPIILEPPSQLSHLTRAILSQYSPLSSQSTPLNTPLPPQNTPHRMSALEIAQKYRQQQIMQQQKQHQVMLPTPPSSTSPLWSSGFSPYQESLLSPEVLAATRWSHGPGKQHSGGQPRHSAQAPLRPENAQDMHRLPYDQIHVSNMHAHPEMYLNPLHLPTAPHSDDHLNYPQDLALSSNALDLTLFNTPSNIQRRAHVAGSTNSVSSRVQASPGPPRAPPNTPLANHVITYQSKYAEKPDLPGLTSPLSPTSPDTGSRSFSQQHPRSIPLNRLIQRRLSSVPEEDSSSVSCGQPQTIHEAMNQRLRRASGGTAYSQNIDGPAINVAQRSQQRKLSGSGHPQTQVMNPGGGPLGRFQEASRSGHIGNAMPSQVKSSVRVGRAQEPVHMKERPPPVVEQGFQQDGENRSARGGRPRGGRGRGAKRGRTITAGTVNGPERVDGGLTVRS